jgi:hypothetical protein
MRNLSIWYPGNSVFSKQDNKTMKLPYKPVLPAFAVTLFLGMVTQVLRIKKSRSCAGNFIGC